MKANVFAIAMDPLNQEVYRVPMVKGMVYSEAVAYLEWLRRHTEGAPLAIAVTKYLKGLNPAVADVKFVVEAV